MSSVPRPLIAVLAVTALFFALWTVALKKTLTGSGSHSGNTPSAPVLQSAINKAKGVQALVNSASARAGGTSTPTTTTPSATTTPPTTTTPTTTTPNTKAAAPAQKTSAHAAASAGSAPKHGTGTAPVLSLPHSGPTRLALVAQALQHHKVLALLVYNPAASDDRAVNSELKSIPTHGGKVIKVSVPVQDLGSFSSLLNEVPVNFSPTLVLIDRNLQADEIAGFADAAEIAQRVDAALRSVPAKQSKH